MDSTTNNLQLPLPNFGDERRKYTFYRIVNTENGKCYVGLTHDVKTRKSLHFGQLQNGNHHNTHLQYAYQKYGSDAFQWENIERKLLTESDAFEREIYWIAHFDSFENGYNMTQGGEGASKPCVWNGIQYNSVSEAAMALGISGSSMSWRLTQGYTCDDDVAEHRRWNIRVCVWNGIEYPSVADAARAIGVSVKAMEYRMRQGFTCDNDMTDPNKPCTWNGVEYPSRKSAALALGIAEKTIIWRLQNGYACDEDMQGAVICIWNDIEYPSHKAAARAVGIPYTTFRHWIAKGYKSDNDVKK